MRRAMWVLFLLCTGLFFACQKNAAPGAAAGGHGDKATEILWDSWGVPHVFARDETELFHALGWAQARNHGNLMLKLYGQSRGRAAQYWGEEYLASDRWIRTNGVPTRAIEWLGLQTPEFRSYLQAFVAGINEYARAHPDEIAEEKKVVLPVTVVDVLAHEQQALHFTFVFGRRRIQAIAPRWKNTAGSNGWAIAPARSASGHSLLLANPHLPWFDLYRWFEAQLVTPKMNLYGATLVGSPVLSIAFNDHLGWTHTVNTHDGADLYQLKLVPGGYLLDGKVREFATVEETIRVKNKDGSLREEALTIKRSVHGPVVATSGKKALALRVVGLDRPHAAEQWWQMGLAKNLDEFQTALRRMQMPMFTVMYADRAGHIMHFFGGLTPVRSGGDWQSWQGIVAGDTEKNLWTKYHSYDELPRVIDPLSGWLQNANDAPWTTTFPLALDRGRFPAYMAPHKMDFRAQRSARMLAEDSHISFDELLAYKHSARMELADRILDDLLAAVAKYGSVRSKKAAAVLKTWDRQANAESRGAVLFAAFVSELARASGGRLPFATAWNKQRPRTTPSGLRDPAAAARALDAAAAQVAKKHGSLDVPWGTVYRLRGPGLDLPANGGPGHLGIFRVLFFQDGQAAGGDSYVAAVEFGDTVRARVLTAPGNATQPGSPHLTDQLPLAAKKELREVWRTRKEIEAHTESRKSF